MLYGTAAALAALLAFVAGIPIYREWARLAVGPYALAAVLSALPAVLPAVRARAGGWPSVRVRAWLAACVLIATALIPLAVESTLRTRTGMGYHAQSEAIVTEEAAKALLGGRNPYAAMYLHGPLVARPLGTKTHFPYLPAMVAFGLPRALDGDSPLADARVWFAAAALVMGAMAIRGRGPDASTPSLSPEGRLLAFQVLAVLPTGALLLATGGDDVPVLAAVLLSLVFLRDRRPIASGVVLGVAAAMKQTAWIVLPFVVLAAPRGSRARALSASAAVAVPVIVPFVLWNAVAFVEDAVRFPLGLGRERSAAGTPTLGTALVSAFPGQRVLVTVLLVAAVAAVAGYLLVCRPPRTASAAAGSAAILFAVGLLLAPAARSGYLVYPIDLAAWAVALRPVDSSRGAPEEP